VQRIFSTERCERKIMSGELESTIEEVVMAYFLSWLLIAATLQNYKYPIAAKLQSK
jgi:hypothetical protein